MKLKEFRRSAATIPVSAAVPDLREEIAAASKITSAPRSLAVAVPIPNAKTTHVSKCFKTTSTSSSKTPGTPISETRRSVRGKGQDAEPILQKAVCRTAEKKGTHSPNSAFAMFPKLSDEHFLAVASSCNLVLDPSVSSPSQLLSLVRAKELAQAALAEAAANVTANATQQTTIAKPVSATGLDIPSTSQRQELPAELAPDATTTKSIVTRTKQLPPKKSSPFKRNLRATPARQARASTSKS